MRRALRNLRLKRLFNAGTSELSGGIPPKEDPMPGLLVGGLAALTVGLIMFFVWLGAVLILVKALAALGFIGAGAVGIYLGWAEFMDHKKPALDFSSQAEAARYRAEAAAYQEELAEINKEKVD
jgi:hypothetical protein